MMFYVESKKNYFRQNYLKKKKKKKKIPCPKIKKKSSFTFIKAQGKKGYQG